MYLAEIQLDKGHHTTVEFASVDDWWNWIKVRNALARELKADNPGQFTLVTAVREVNTQLIAE